MKEMPVILAVILICGYSVRILLIPTGLERDRQAMVNIRAKAEARWSAAVDQAEAAVQPFVDDLLP